MKKYIGMIAVIFVLSSCDNQNVIEPEMQYSQSDAVSGILFEHMDKSINPGDDFFEYVNGAWLKNTEIPADKSSYGSFNILRDNSEEDVRVIIEEAASSGAESGSN